MLVLSRKCGEEIVIDGSITIRVVQCANGRVRLGFDAPDDIRIVRSEIAFEGSPTTPQKSSGCLSGVG